MINPNDPRHLSRQKAIKQLFAWQFHKQTVTHPKTKQVISEVSSIDNIILQLAPEFPIAKINNVDLAILRLAVYELKFEKKEPPKAVVDEAIELAHEFGNESSAPFVNGALGKLIQS